MSILHLYVVHNIRTQRTVSHKTRTNLIVVGRYRFKACKVVVEKNKISFTGKLKAKPVMSDGIKPTFHSSLGLRHFHFPTNFFFS